MTNQEMVENVMAMVNNGNPVLVEKIVESGFGALAGKELGNNGKQRVFVDFLAAGVWVETIETGEQKFYNDEKTKQGAIMTHAANVAIESQKHSMGRM